MRRTIVGLVLFFALLAPAYAQGETYTWEPHSFTVTLPAGWQAVMDADGRLLLGLPDDVQRIQAGQATTGLGVVVQIIPPPPTVEEFEVDDAVRLSNFLNEGRDALRVAVENQRYGSQEWPTANIPALDARQGRLVLAAQTFLLTASAPTDVWDDLEPVLDELLATIEASPVAVTRPPDLTQPVAWRDLHITVPADWITGSTGTDYGIIITTLFNNRYRSVTFQHRDLTLSIRDLSYVRPLLGAESLLFVDTFLYDRSAISSSDIQELEVNGIPAYRVAFTASPNGEGEAVLLLTPRHAFLLVGVAAVERWAESEGTLFAAILESATIQ